MENRPTVISDPAQRRRVLAQRLPDAGAQQAAGEQRRQLALQAGQYQQRAHAANLLQTEQCNRPPDRRHFLADADKGRVHQLHDLKRQNRIGADDVFQRLQADVAVLQGCQQQQRSALARRQSAPFYQLRASMVIALKQTKAQFHALIQHLNRFDLLRQQRNRVFAQTRHQRFDLVHGRMQYVDFDKMGERQQRLMPAQEHVVVERDRVTLRPQRCQRLQHIGSDFYIFQHLDHDSRRIDGRRPLEQPQGEIDKSRSAVQHIFNRQRAERIEQHRGRGGIAAAEFGMLRGTCAKQQLIGKNAVPCVVDRLASEQYCIRHNYDPPRKRIP